MGGYDLFAAGLEIDNPTPLAWVELESEEVFKADIDSPSPLASVEMEIEEVFKAGKDQVFEADQDQRSKATQADQLVYGTSSSARRRQRQKDQVPKANQADQAE